MKVVIFTIEGTTLLFEGVTDLTDHGDTLEFTHRGVSLGESRVMKVLKDRILGYSTSKEK